MEYFHGNIKTAIKIPTTITNIRTVKSSGIKKVTNARNFQVIHQFFLLRLMTLNVQIESLPTSLEINCEKPPPKIPWETTKHIHPDSLVDASTVCSKKRPKSEHNDI